MTTKSVFLPREGRQYPVVDPASLPSLQPMPDAMQQESHYIDAVTTLRAHFSSDPGVLVSGNTIVCYDPDNLNRRVLPDCYITFNVDPLAIRDQNGFLIWQVGKPPDFVLEIGSESTAVRDLTSKRDLYAEMGVPEYWRFDPTGGEHYGQPLVGERLVDGEYQPFDLNANSDGLTFGYSPMLGINLCLQEGRLAFQEPDTGRYLINLEETQDVLVTQQTTLATQEATLATQEATLATQEAALATQEATLATQEATLAAERAARRETERALAQERARVRELEERLRRSNESE